MGPQRSLSLILWDGEKFSALPKQRGLDPGLPSPSLKLLPLPPGSNLIWLVGMNWILFWCYSFKKNLDMSTFFHYFKNSFLVVWFIFPDEKNLSGVRSCKRERVILKFNQSWGELLKETLEKMRGDGIEGTVMGLVLGQSLVQSLSSWRSRVWASGGIRGLDVVVGACLNVLLSSVSLWRRHEGNQVRVRMWGGRCRSFEGRKEDVK